MFSTVAAVAALLDQCIQLCSRIQGAIRRQKGLAELIHKHTLELTQTKAMIDLVTEEPSLRTPSIHSALAKLNTVIQALRTQLGAMATPRGRIRGFILQLIAGRRNQEALEAIMRDMARIKLDLGVHIQLANVGLTRGVEEKTLVSVAAVDSINRQLREKLGLNHELRISRLIKGRPLNSKTSYLVRTASKTLTNVSGDGTVTLSKDDITFLSTPPEEDDLVAAPTRNGFDLPRPNASRTVRGNQASHHALQVNTPIGQDIWEDVSTVRIEDNRAMGFASQLNYPTSAEAFLAVLEARHRQRLLTD